MKRHLILSIVLFAIFVQVTNAKEKPNILFVYIDDMGYGDLGCYGNKIHQTPNIDKLASEGLLFHQFYVNAPICSPSRVAVTTGQYPGRWGITSFINDRKSNQERGMKDFLSLEAPSLAKNLQNAGYYTAHIGKWHMGGGRDIGDVPYIQEYGFNESVTQFEGIGERYLATFESLNLKDSTRNLEKMSAALGKGEVHWVKRENFTEIFVGRVIKAIETAKSEKKPFYINLWPDDVHSPHEPPRALRGTLSKEDRYSGVISEMDTQLAKLFDFIKKDPILENNTIIIISSDNGPEKGVGSAGVLKGNKTNIYEGGIREPLIVWAPEIISKKAQKSNNRTVIAGIDLAPSILKITGAKKESGIEYDGVDMSKALLGYAQPLRTKPIMWMRPPGTKTNTPDLAIREGDYKLLIDADGTGAELYNITKDEIESLNLIDQLPELASDLKKKVMDWYAQMTPLTDIK